MHLLWEPQTVSFVISCVLRGHVFDALLLSTACWSTRLMQPWSYRQALWHGHLRVHRLKDFFSCVCANPHFHAQALCHGRGDGFYPTRGQLEGLWWGSRASAVFLGVPCRCNEILQPFTMRVAVAQHCEQGSAELASTDHHPHGRRRGG